MGIELVQQQLIDKCPCYKDCEVDDVKGMADQLVDNISLSTCWTTKSCETLLYSDREERIEFPCLTCDCCGNIERFRPYFQEGISKDTTEVTIITQSGLDTEEVKVDVNDFGVTKVKGYYEFLVNLENYGNYCNCSNCDVMYIVFKYKAGYEKLPDCLFPEVCDLIKVMEASNLGCGGIDDCCKMTQAEVGYALKSKKKGEISYTWEQNTEGFAYLFNQLLIGNMFKNLGMISLCGTHTDDYRSRLWVVVSDGSR